MSSHQVLILIFNVLNFCVLTNLVQSELQNPKLSVNALKLNKKIPTSNHYGGSDGYTYTYIRTPYYATRNGYSYGPYQYKYNFRNHYKPKHKQPENVKAINSKSYAPSKPIVQNYQTFANQPVKTPPSALIIPRRTYGYRPITQFKTVGETPAKGFVIKPVKAKVPLKQAHSQAPVKPNPAPATPFIIRPDEPKPLRDFLSGKVQLTPAPIRAPITPTPAPAAPAQTPLLTQQTILPVRTTPSTTTTRRTTTTTTRPTAKLAEEVGDNLVLDFSSGQPEMIANTANEVEVKSEEEVADSPAAKNAFSKFRELIELVGVNEVLKEAGNFTIFSPLNTAFDELDTSIEDVPLTTIRRWILKHFVKDFLFKRDMVNGPLKTLGGEFVTISKNPETNKVRVFSLSGQANVKVANIKTKFGLVHVIDTVLT